MYTITIRTVPMTSGASGWLGVATSPIVMTKNSVPTNSVRYFLMGLLQGKRGAGTARGLAELAKPDVPVPDRMSVVLQRQRQLVGMRGIRWARLVGGGPGEHHPILHQHAVLEHRHDRRLEQLSPAVEAGPVEHDVVGLPDSGPPARVDQRRVLPIDRPGLAVGIGHAPVGVQDLHFVETHEKHAAVAAVLVLAHGGQRRGPLDVELHIAKPSY